MIRVVNPGIPYDFGIDFRDPGDLRNELKSGSGIGIPVRDRQPQSKPLISKLLRSDEFRTPPDISWVPNLLLIGQGVLSRLTPEK
jgi:hypothetical protein